MKPFEESSFLIVWSGEGVEESRVVTGWDRVCKHLAEEGFEPDELRVNDPDSWTTCSQDDSRFECYVQFEIGFLRITRVTSDLT